MKKTYWWRIAVLVLSTFLVFTSYFIFEYIYYLRKIFAEPLFLLSLSLLLVSPFLFFIQDKTFFLWLKLALIWFSLAFFFVALSPDYRGGWLGIGPTKESVSLSMGGIFFLGSLLFFVWHWLRKS